MKQILFATITTFFFLLTSCDNFLTSEEKDGIYLKYLGESNSVQRIVDFKLVNNSNITIEYWGYSPKYPFSSYQIKNDTGWTRNLSGWCGTGAIVNELPANTSIEFTTSKPDSFCVWRLTFDYNIKGLEGWETIYSEPIQNQR